MRAAVAHAAERSSARSNARSNAGGRLRAARMAAKVASVMAALRASTGAERVSAAARLTKQVDLNEVSAQEEPVAVDRHEAAVAYARAGACAALAPMLLPTASKEEQQAACAALRCVFNVLFYLHDCLKVPVVRDAVTLPAAEQLWAGGCAESLCALMATAPDSTSAINACCALRLVVLAAGWSPHAERCLNTDGALTSLMALAGGEVVPAATNYPIAALDLLKAVQVNCGAKMRSLAAPGVLSSGALPLLLVLAPHKVIGAHALGVLARFLETDEGMRALQPYRGVLLDLLLDMLLQCECRNDAALHLLSTLAFGEAPGSLWFSELLCSSGVTQLEKLCTSIAPQQHAVWSASGRTSAADKRKLMPAVCALALCCKELAPAALVAGLLATVPQGAALKETLLAMHAAYSTQPFALFDAAPLSAAAIGQLKEAWQKQRAKALKAEYRSSEAHLTASEMRAMESSRPLLLASRAAVSPRARTALARANLLDCQHVMAHCRSDDTLREWSMINTAGFMCHMMMPRHAGDFIYSFSSGLQDTVQGPEIIVLGGVAGLDQTVLLRLTGQLCWKAGTLVLDAVTETGAPAYVAALLCRKPMLVSERDAGLVPWAYSQLGGGKAVPAHVAAAASKLVWHLHRYGSRDADAMLMAEGGHAATLQSCFFGRKRAAFYKDVACAGKDAITELPTLVCSLGACLQGAAGAVVVRALAMLGATPAPHSCPGEPGPGNALLQLMCANEACAGRQLGQVTKRCTRCMVARYCGPLCQKADWPRHKSECVPPKPPAA